MSIRDDQEVEKIVQAAVPSEEVYRREAALIYAVKLSAIGYMQKEINDGVNVNYQDSFGMTALHYAAMMNARPCIRMLVGSGKCDYLIRDEFGRYASDLALEHGNDVAVMYLLLKHQARQAIERGVRIADRG